MATNRKTSNGQDDVDPTEAMFPLSSLGMEPESITGRYIGFEQLVGTLIWACMESKLHLYNVSSVLDTTSLERRFRGNCVPVEWEPPHELVAELDFVWPAEYTTLSIYGDEAFCALYHDEEEACSHQEDAADMFVELEIDYHLPFGFVSSLNSDEGVEATARRIREVFQESVNHENIVAVQATATFTGDTLKLTAIKAHNHWTLEAELLDLQLLGQVLLSICQEIRAALLGFAEAFPNGGSGEDW